MLVPATYLRCRFPARLKLIRFPPHSPLPIAALPSMSLSQKAQFPCSRRVLCRSSHRAPLCLVRANHETFNRVAANESVHNLGNVRDRDAPVKEVIRFDQNRHTSGALIETARCADARFALGESARGNLRFQCAIYFFRILGSAASFRVVLGPTIDTDKQITLALQRGESRIRRAGRQRPKKVAR